MSIPAPITVAHLVRSIKSALERNLGSLWVEGEISNFKTQASGHSYFTLKDENAQISCVFFRGAALKSPVKAGNGLKVKVYAEVSVYEPRGQVQLIVKIMEDAGRGSLQQQFDALKKKLQEEGLFSQERKKALPAFPERVGIITSPTGAVIQDIIHVFERRAPWIQLYLCPVRVQGEEATREIASAVTRWGSGTDESLPPVDLIIIGRGGGSLEDLWCFNEESVARAITQSRIPIISAVGHETDFTIADFVADLRAPTPTAAAELATPDGPALSRQISHRWLQAQNSLEKILEAHELRLNVFAKGILSTSPEKVLRDFIQLIDEQESSLLYSIENAVNTQNHALRRLSLKLSALNPEKQIDWHAQSLEKLTRLFYQSVTQGVEYSSSKLNEMEKLLIALGPESAFKRGYSVVKDSHGHIVRDPKSLQHGDSLHITLEKGAIDATVQ